LFISGFVSSKFSPIFNEEKSSSGMSFSMVACVLVLYPNQYHQPRIQLFLLHEIQIVYMNIIYGTY
jgi:hypothetical protein